jgi:hypothetical protein
MHQMSSLTRVLGSYPVAVSGKKGSEAVDEG